MVGKNLSFFKLLHDEVPHTLQLRCICHSAALVASHACEFLPRSPEELLRNVYNYVSGSAKRCAQLQEMQEYFQDKKLKILKLATTRWLSRHECVTRILYNWTTLEHYFRIAVVEDKLKSAEIILTELTNIYTKAYLLFLKYSLSYFNNFNALFQSRKPLIHVLYAETFSLMKQICKNFIKAQYLDSDLSLINLRDPKHFIKLEDIYVGPECSELFPNMPLDGKTAFLKNCLVFYIEASVDLQKRLPDKIFKEIGFLNADIAFNKAESDRNINFNVLCNQFFLLDIDKSEIQIEWRKLNDLFSNSEISYFKTLPIDEMWSTICTKTCYDETLAFPNLQKLVRVLLVLPHSNAEAERIFSILTDTKTKKRNRLAETSLNAICTFRSFLQSKEDNDVVTYKINEEHLNLHKLDMYSFKNKN